MKKSAASSSRKNSPKPIAPSSEEKPRRGRRPAKKRAGASGSENPGSADAGRSGENSGIESKQIRVLGKRLSEAFLSLAQKRGVDAAQQLSTFVSKTVAPTLCRFLNDTGRWPALDHISAEALALFECLYSSAMMLSEELLAYVRKNPQSEELISELRSWPVLISTNPRRDIRKVVKNPGGAAAKHYERIIRLLGTQRLLDFSNTRRQGLSHSRAKKAAEVLCHWLEEERNHRALGLPWLCDYPDGVIKCELPTVVKTGGKNGLNVPRLGDKRAWAIAVRYYLFLTLAPEPWRTRIRQKWRAKREECFSAFVPLDIGEARLHAELCKTEALVSSAAAGSGPVMSRGGLYKRRLPRLMLNGGSERWGSRRPDNLNAEVDCPQWLHWWNTYLQFQPDSLFDSTLAHGMRQKTGSISDFRTFVDKVLNAFLVGAGVRDGLKKIQGGDQLPRIAGSESNAGDP
ncbi:MAG: hypothetical protein K8R23_09175 [Chthoniobacter sp.]|nr:hypothetical protein [Chthoniobacter sp.]